MWNEGLYVALCLILPVLWGMLSAYLFDLWQVRFGRHDSSSEETMNEDMYYI